jgi:hypothetical protein
VCGIDSRETRGGQTSVICAQDMDVRRFSFYRRRYGSPRVVLEVKVLRYGKTVAVENFSLRLLFIKCHNDVKIKKFEMDSTCKLER